MFYKIAVLAATAGIVIADGVPSHFAIQNGCDFDVEYQRFPSAGRVIKSGEVIATGIEGPSERGNAYIVTRRGTPEDPFMTLIAEVVLKKEGTYYGLAPATADKFVGFPIGIVGEDKSCEKITWEQGEPVEGSPNSSQCAADTNVVLHLC